jgi:hypothetical protein
MFYLILLILSINVIVDFKPSLMFIEGLINPRVVSVSNSYHYNVPRILPNKIYSLLCLAFKQNVLEKTAANSSKALVSVG